MLIKSMQNTFNVIKNLSCDNDDDAQHMLQKKILLRVFMQYSKRNIFVLF